MRLPMTLQFFASNMANEIGEIVTQNTRSNSQNGTLIHIPKSKLYFHARFEEAHFCNLGQLNTYI